jgi:3-oxoacyl-ACP reductase-like protein
MPSFASLRDPRRRTALDLLVPAAGPAGDGTGSEADREPEPEPQPEPEPVPGPAPAPAAVRPAAPAPRPAEYADLLHLGARLARAAVTVPGRLALWSVRTQVDLLRRLLGG